MKIRFAKKEDLIEISEIVSEAWWEETKKSFTKEFKSSFINVAINQKFVVILDWKKIIWVWSFWLGFLNYYSYEISWICVLKSYQNKWIWKKIVNFIINKIKNFVWDIKAKIIILTAKDNAHIQNFYTKLWFKKLYSYVDLDWENACLMILDL